MSLKEDEEKLSHPPLTGFVLYERLRHHCLPKPLSHPIGKNGLPIYAAGAAENVAAIKFSDLGWDAELQRWEGGTLIGPRSPVERHVGHKLSIFMRPSCHPDKQRQPVVMYPSPEVSLRTRTEARRNGQATHRRGTQGGNDGGTTRLSVSIQLTPSICTTVPYTVYTVHGGEIPRSAGQLERERKRSSCRAQRAPAIRRKTGTRSDGRTATAVGAAGAGACQADSVSCGNDGGTARLSIPTQLSHPAPMRGCHVHRARLEKFLALQADQNASAREVRLYISTEAARRNGQATDGRETRVRNDGGTARLPIPHPFAPGHHIHGPWWGKFLAPQASQNVSASGAAAGRNKRQLPGAQWWRDRYSSGRSGWCNRNDVATC
ncbi:hypothetical protein B0H13DRAFT_1852047 [Mycena leptocephala]|nr:hypothetical protein B0H13DRAFT_1852047 [Mycena leptocephala]